MASRRVILEYGKMAMKKDFLETVASSFSELQVQSKRIASRFRRPDLAEEALQEFFIVGVERPFGGQYDPTKPSHNYFQLLNRFHDLTRQEKHRHQQFPERFDPVSPDPGPCDVLALREEPGLATAVGSVIDALPPRHRLVMHAVLEVLGACDEMPPKIVIPGIRQMDVHRAIGRFRQLWIDTHGKPVARQRRLRKPRKDKGQPRAKRKPTC